MPYRVVAFLCMLSLASCVDDKDYALDSVTLSPTLAIPLASGDIGMTGLLSNTDSAYLKVYSDGLLYFSYTKAYPSRDIHDRLAVNNSTSTYLLDLPAGTLGTSSSDAQYSITTKSYDLNLSPQQINEMLMNSGSVSYALGTSQPTSPNTLPYEVHLTFADVVDKNTLQPLTINAQPGSGSKSIQNYQFTMVANTFSVKLELILKQRANAIFIAPGTKVNVQVSFLNMNFKYIKGFFGDQIINFPVQNIDITAFGSSLKKAKVTFLQSVMGMSIRNDNGAPCEVTFLSLEAKKTGATLPIQINPTSPITLGYPSVLGNSSTTEITVGNADAVVNFSPTQLSYSARVRINKGLVSGNNFMADTSKLNVNLKTEVPLYGMATGIALADTLKIDLSGIKESQVSNSSLRVKSTNQLPLDATLQIYLTDDSYKIIDSLFVNNQTYLVRASTVTATGELLAAGSTDFKLDISAEKINKLFDSKYLIVRSKMSTTKDANGAALNVKFKSTYRLKLTVGLLTKLTLTAK